MRAMRLRRPAAVASAPLQADTLPWPVPGPGELRLRVRACATCRTDLHVVEGELAARRLPVVPGHQVVGVVDALGPGARRFAPGDRVGAAWLRSTCGRCRRCAAGRENLCGEATYTGWTHDGGYAEALCVPEAYAYAIPAAFEDAEAAPLLCAGIIGYRALAQAAVPAGGRLALYGFGSSAHVTIQVARHRGCEVLAVTRDPAHRTLARELGAVWAGGPDESLPAPVDAAIIFAPAGELVPRALAGLDRGGTLVLAGIHMSTLPPLDYERHLFWERSIRSVTANTRQDGEALLAEAAAIPIRPRVQRYRLAEANQALQDLATDRVAGTAVLVVG
jgi:propanol-preferring alcohol dehydrogenase